jgi:uncharacterized protein YbjQ (UPF0145 family)
MHSRLAASRPGSDLATAVPVTRPPPATSAGPTAAARLCVHSSRCACEIHTFSSSRSGARIERLYPVHHTNLAAATNSYPNLLRGYAAVGHKRLGIVVTDDHHMLNADGHATVNKLRMEAEQIGGTAVIGVPIRMGSESMGGSITVTVIGTEVTRHELLEVDSSVLLWSCPRA